MDQLMEWTLDADEFVVPYVRETYGPSVLRVDEMFPMDGAIYILFAYGPAFRDDDDPALEAAIQSVIAAMHAAVPQAAHIKVTYDKISIAIRDAPSKFADDDDDDLEGNEVEDYLLKFGTFVGERLEGCVVTLTRYDDAMPFHWDECETWFAVVRDKKLRLLYGEADWYKDLFKSKSGRLYSVGRGLLVGTPRDDGGYDFQTYECPVSGVTVFTLDDRFVFVAGHHSIKHPHVIARLDLTTGKHDLYDLPRIVDRVRGCAPDTVYGVGEKGLVVRFDGTQFVQVPVDEADRFNSLLIVSEREMIASTMGGNIWDGSVNGWSRRAQGPGTMYMTARIGGDLYCGTEAFGIHKLVDHTTEQVNLKHQFRDIVAGDQCALLGSNEQLAETTTFKKLKRVHAKDLKPLIDTIEPLWRSTSKIWKA